jgi:hypothetical protein
MPLDRSKHPLVLLKAIEDILDTFEDWKERYGDTVEAATPHDKVDEQMINASFIGHTNAIRPIDKSLDFYFEVRGVRFTGGTISYWIAYRPASPTTIEEHIGGDSLDGAQKRFKGWFDLVKAYQSVRISKEERFTAEAAKQFYADFELVDEDASTAPFDNDKQLLVYKLLEFVKETVEQAEDGDHEEAKTIIQQIENLQQSIPRITKTAVIKELSKIYAKVKAYSMKAFVAVYDVAKKELIKHYLYESMDGANEFIKTFHLPHH